MPLDACKAAFLGPAQVLVTRSSKFLCTVEYVLTIWEALMASKNGGLNILYHWYSCCLWFWADVCWRNRRLLLGMLRPGKTLLVCRFEISSPPFHCVLSVIYRLFDIENDQICCYLVSTRAFQWFAGTRSPHRNLLQLAIGLHPAQRARSPKKTSFTHWKSCLLWWHLVLIWTSTCILILKSFGRSLLTLLQWLAPSLYLQQWAARWGPGYQAHSHINNHQICSLSELVDGLIRSRSGPLM